MKTMQLDWNKTAKKATRMTDSELIFARADCLEAAEAARALDRAGCIVIKTEGYYHDESSVYAVEQNRRTGFKN